MKLQDVPYDLAYEFHPSSAVPPIQIPSAGGSVSVWITAPVVGTDGLTHDTFHTAWLGTLRVTKKRVRIVFDPRSVLRRGETLKNRNMFLKEFTLPREFRSMTAAKSLRLLADRLGFLITPQSPELFRGPPARELCKRIHDYLVVHDVMTS